jgi:hypothetical protein
MVSSRCLVHDLARYTDHEGWKLTYLGLVVPNANITPLVARQDPAFNDGKSKCGEESSIWLHQLAALTMVLLDGHLWTAPRGNLDRL